MLFQRFASITPDDIVHMPMEKFTEKIRRFRWQLRWHIINGTHQNTGSTKASDVACGFAIIPVIAPWMVQTIWTVNGCALTHEFNGTARIG